MSASTWWRGEPPSCGRRSCVNQSEERRLRGYRRSFVGGTDSEHPIHLKLLAIPSERTGSPIDSKTGAPNSTRVMREEWDGPGRRTKRPLRHRHSRALASAMGEQGGRV